MKLSSVSIAVRLPAAMVALVSALFVALIAIAHARVRQSVVQADAARLHSAASSLAEVFDASVQRVTADARRVRDSPAWRGLQASGAAPRPAARAVRDIHRQSPQTLAVAYWHDGKLIAFDGPARAALAIPPVTLGSSRSAIRIGRIAMLGDTALFGSTISLDSANASSDAVVLVRRAVLGANRVFPRLIDARATVLLGNDTGRAWLRISAEGMIPRTSLQQDSIFEFADEAGLDYLAASAPLPGTPWRAVVALPLSVSAAAADRTLGLMAEVALVFLVLAAVGGWAIVSRFATPIVDIADAAMAFSRGDHARRVSISSSDEVGRLGSAFNVMADKTAAAARDSADRAAALEGANRALRETEARYRALAEQSPDGIVVHRDFRILFGNAAAARILGASSMESIVGASFLQFVAPSRRIAIEARVRGIQQRADSPPPIELEIVRADGTRLQAECSGMQLTIDGGPAVQTIMRDVTERLRLEEQERRSQRMEAVGKLAGGVAHEFNNLLTVIQAYSEFAARGTDEDTRRTDIDEVRRAAMAASQLTRQLLAFSRRQVIIPRRVDLVAVVAEIADVLPKVVGDKTRVAIDGGPGPCWAWADPGQMRQMLMNLAHNARDAMPDGGTLRIGTKSVTFDEPVDAWGSTVTPGDYVEVVVEDDGAGMTDEVKTRAFDPFFTTKIVGHGTGLGLATVYGIVRQAEGHIRLESAPRLGTRISIYLPRPADMELPLVNTGEFAVPGGRNVLLVDDDSAVRRALRRALENGRFVVWDAANAAEAVALFEQGQPVDILVTDMVMPGDSGVRLIDTLRRRAPDLPAIVISGYTDEHADGGWQLPDRCLFLEKPISPRALVREVSRMLSGHS